MMGVFLLTLLLLGTKHFIIDFLLQGPYQWKNKGTWMHPGGILHAGLHSVGTFLCFVGIIDMETALLLSALDGILHYLIDYSKMNINKEMGWGANTHAQFWWLLGLDQYLHHLTYVLLLWIAFGG